MIALCHEWLAHRMGSEKTFEAMAEAIPSADLYALTWDRSAAVFDFGGRQPATTFLDRGPFTRMSRRAQLPLMPLAWRYVTDRRYDVVVTSSHACAKGFRPARQALHLCYCFTPMRYVWVPDIDARTGARLAATAATVPRLALQAWDRRSVAWVASFAAISGAVRARIERFYERPAKVIHPPVDTEFFSPGPPDGGDKGEFVLAASRFVRYKRLDLAIRACAALRYPLIVAGAGPEEAALRALAAELAADIRFIIAPDDEQLRTLYRRARALVFPAYEDFGIVAVEAQACGTPVVGIAAGGSLDTVVHGETGVLVPDADVVSVTAGLAQVLVDPPSADRCRRHALGFSTARFINAFRGWVEAEAAGRGLAVSLDGTGVRESV